MPLSCVQNTCVRYGLSSFFDPAAGVVTSRFICGLFPAATSCVGCVVCRKCGELSCTCGFLSIQIDVKMKGTIETVPLRGGVGE